MPRIPTRSPTPGATSTPPAKAAIPSTGIQTRNRRRLDAMFTRSLIFVHRWLGVALCLIFLLWFPSGIGMMYWDYPSVSPGDRLDHAAALDPATIVLSPSEAAAKLGEGEQPGQIHLNTFDSRPVYRFRSGRGEAIVYADTGDEQIEVTKALVDRAAANWTGQPVAAATVTPVEEVDQWTLQSRLRDLQP